MKKQNDIIDFNHQQFKNIGLKGGADSIQPQGPSTQSGEENSTGNRPKPDGDSYGDDVGGGIPR